MRGTMIPVIMTVYSDRSFDFIMKRPRPPCSSSRPPASRRAAPVPHTDKVGKVTKAQVTKIAETKMRGPERPQRRRRHADRRGHGPLDGHRHQGLAHFRDSIRDSGTLDPSTQFVRGNPELLRGRAASTPLRGRSYDRARARARAGRAEGDADEATWQAIPAGLKTFSREKRYGLDEAVAILGGFPKAKFDETVELAVRLGIDPGRPTRPSAAASRCPRASARQARWSCSPRATSRARRIEAGADRGGRRRPRQEDRGGLRPTSTSRSRTRR